MSDKEIQGLMKPMLHIIKSLDKLLFLIGSGIFIVDGSSLSHCVGQQKSLLLLTTYFWPKLRATNIKMLKSNDTMIQML